MYFSLETVYIYIYIYVLILTYICIHTCILLFHTYTLYALVGIGSHVLHILLCSIFVTPRSLHCICALEYYELIIVVVVMYTLLEAACFASSVSNSSGAFCGVVVVTVSGVAK